MKPAMIGSRPQYSIAFSSSTQSERSVGDHDHGRRIGEQAAALGLQRVVALAAIVVEQHHVEPVCGEIDEDAEAGGAGIVEGAGGVRWHEIQRDAAGEVVRLQFGEIAGFHARAVLVGIGEGDGDVEAVGGEGQRQGRCWRCRCRRS